MSPTARASILRLCHSRALLAAGDQWGQRPDVESAAAPGEADRAAAPDLDAFFEQKRRALAPFQLKVYAAAILSF